MKPPSKLPKPCKHPEHNPPSHLYIKPGETHVHKCPGCGAEFPMKTSVVSWSS